MRDKKRETFRPSGHKKTEVEKYRDLRLLAPGKPCFHTKKAFIAWFAKTNSTQVLVSPNPVPPSADAAAAYA